MNDKIKKKRRLIIGLSLIVVVFAAVTTAVYSTKMNFYKDSTLTSLEEEKARFENKGEKVPDSLLKKIDAEIQYAIRHQEDFEKCRREVEERKKLLEKAPKDEKGNPILPDRKPPTPGSVKPHKDTGHIGDKIDALALLTSIELKKHIPSCTIVAPYNVLVAGKYEGGSFILNVKEREDGSGIERKFYYYPDIKNITFTGLDKDQKIVEFTFNNGKKGIFDLENEIIKFR